jgi:hypothetical protein
LYATAIRQMMCPQSTKDFISRCHTLVATPKKLRSQLASAHHFHIINDDNPIAHKSELVTEVPVTI